MHRLASVPDVHDLLSDAAVTSLVVVRILIFNVSRGTLDNRSKEKPYLGRNE